MTESSSPLAGLRSEMDVLRRRLADIEPTFETHSMELLSCLLANAVDFIAMLSPDGHFLFLNRVREGARMEDLLDSSVYAWIPPSQHDSYRACLERVVRTGKVEATETEVRFSDGVSAWFETRVSPIRDGDRVIALTIVATDVSAHKRALRALRESEQKLRMAVDAAGIGLWSWDSRSDAITWDDGMCGLFGISPGSSPRDRPAFVALVHEEDRVGLAEVIATYRATGRWPGAEYRIRRPDGSVRWIMAKASAVAGGDPGLLVGAALDVTERRLRDERLRQAQKLDAVGQLTAGIAHNFNNMLMGVLPYLELALKGASPQIVPLLLGAEQSALRAADLVRQLMTYSGRNAASSRRSQPISAIVARTTEICRTTFDRRIAIEGVGEPTARARVDAVQLEQVLLNLLINARDAVEQANVAEPRVEVETVIVRAGAAEIDERPDARNTDHVRIRVRDNGVGMSSSVLARLYEPFFTTKEVGKGTGLGLATAHAIVREHGGFMTCRSSPGEGSTFSIYLPCDCGADDAAAASLDRPAGGRERLLVVDDEPAIRQVVSLMLRSAGYSVEVAGSGKDALDLINDGAWAHELALVLLDVSMPGMPRAEIRARLRELAPQACVVYFTGYGFEPTDPGDCVLEKPVSEARLLTTIRDLLDGRARGSDEAPPPKA